jgi:hypothetical protein
MLRDAKLVNLIGFVGKKGAGKTTCGELLQQLGRDNGLKIIRVSFADPLKRICSDLYCFAYDISPEAFYGSPSEKEQIHVGLGNRSGREVMQFLGTGCFKALTPDVWIAYLMRHIDVVIKYGADLVVIDDVRFADEAAAIRNRRGLVIQIDREGLPNNDSTNQHISETEQNTIDPDDIISNNGDKVTLLRQLQRFL